MDVSSARLTSAPEASFSFPWSRKMMDGFGLLVGHLVGDYIAQDDWMAREKTSEGFISHIACTVHCLLYTLSVWTFTLFQLPWWACLICFLVHWPIDRFRLARKWMNISGQKAFASGELAPWSIIIVDNTIHLVTLWILQNCV